MKKNYKQFLILFFLLAVLLLPYFVFAQTSQDKLNPLKRMEGVAGQGGFAPATETSLASTAGLIVNALFSLLGVIFLTLVIYAGYSWMTASGDENKLEKAKNTLRRAIIGLIITIGSVAIYNFVFIKLT